MRIVSVTMIAPYRRACPDGERESLSMLTVLLLVAGLQPAQTPTPPVPAPERWPLMQLLQGTGPGLLLDDNRLRLYGWTDTSFTASSVAPVQLPMGFNYKSNDLLVQQAWVRFELPVDTSAKTPTFGFRTDNYFGTDYRFTNARGLFSGQLTADNGMPNLYGYEPMQFNCEAYFPDICRGLDVKLGRFYTQIGADSVEAISAPLASRTYNLIYDPYTHTGILSTLKLDSAWTVQSALALGCDVFIDPADTPTYAGSVKWAPPSGRDSVLFSVILCSGRFDQKRNFNNPEVFNLVATHKVNDRLNYILDALFAFQTNVPDMGTVTWFTISQYLIWTLTPRLSATTRLEFFDDPQGQRTGFAGLYTALTTGLTYKPRPWLILRPEVRYDYNDETRPFEGHHGVLTCAMDVVVRW
jgi:hypothetical protein